MQSCNGGPQASQTRPFEFQCYMLPLFIEKLVKGLGMRLTGWLCSFYNIIVTTIKHDIPCSPGKDGLIIALILFQPVYLVVP